MLVEKLSKTWFRYVHGRHLVYNACWEDPRLDREALALGPEETVMVITSAGCNALDYALAGAKQIHAVDMNPRQNSLLELKLAGIRKLAYDEFFALFGQGRLDQWSSLYHTRLRGELSPKARNFWDRHGRFFSGSGRRRSFYFHGTAGTFAWVVNYYVDKVAKVRSAVTEILDADTVDEQREIYERHRLAESLWRPFVKFAMRRDMTLALLGVPRAQRRQIDQQYPGGILQFIVDRVETVFTRLPLKDNYFWRVYLTGQYTAGCCPEYLKPDNFERLKNGVVDRVAVHTDSVLSFLQKHPGEVSRFVLLDHMDWLSREATREVLRAEWQAIIDRAAPNARILWRSAGMTGDFVNPLEVTVAGRTLRVGDLLTYDHELAKELHARDRVHTYGSFCIADVLAGSFAMRATSLRNDLKTLWHLVGSRVRGATHEERLESFYRGQAGGYDDFRRRMLHGRKALFDALDATAGGVWVDLGAGTGENAEHFSERISRFSQVYLVDLSESLLAVARRRIAERGWQNVTAAHADATQFMPPEGFADLVTFSYSLTMIPDWFAAIEQAWQMLKPGGTVGVVDFYVARKFPPEHHRRQSWPTRTFWSLWFGCDNVFLSPDHIPFLERRFETVSLAQERGKIPYLPFVRAPYYRFIGRKPHA